MIICDLRMSKKYSILLGYTMTKLVRVLLFWRCPWNSAELGPNKEFDLV